MYSKYSENCSDTEPLAARLRPQRLEEFIGQTHILALDKPLRQMIAKGALHSMIFWGPPGTGKTTLASIIAQQADAVVEKISAVFSGVKEIRAVVERAELRQQQGQRTLVFVDEVHRFNKSQQDAFLPHVESGLFTFIGATTENPSFEVNNALLSRARVYVLEALTTEEILKILDNALSSALPELEFPDDLRRQLAEFSDGDARRALNMLEILASAANGQLVTDDLLQQVLAGGSTRRFDKGGEAFYDLISALHKSVRGSDPDAALYWFARMIDGGCDPLYIARRVVRMASEDIGNADPRGLEIALNAWQTQQRLGSPEGELAVAQAITYLSVAPKSNAVYVAFKQAMKAAQTHGSLEVPLHIRNAPTKLMKSLDYGKHYRYTHDEPEGYAAGETYLPEELVGERFYIPTNRGLEKKIGEKLSHLKTLDKKHTTKN